MGDKLKILNFSLNFFNELHQRKNIGAVAHVNANLFHLFTDFTFRKFFECVCRHTVAILTSAIHVNLRSLFFRTANFRSQGITFSHIESLCRKLRRTRVISCFELREMTQLR